MTAKEYCEAYSTIAYYSGYTGLEIRGIEYGITDYLFCISGIFCSEKARCYHKLKIYYEGEDAFVRLRRQKIYLSDFIRV